jgi:serine/threonine-protein phosphatase 2A activator
MAQFHAPTKEVKSQADMERFKRSAAYGTLNHFIANLNSAVTGKKASDKVVVSPVVQRMLACLQQLDTWVTETPPVNQPTRFGNKAFRTWLQRVIDNSGELMHGVLSAELRGASVETAPYFLDSFGNQTRIDYGTGHECAFVAWMCCFEQLGLVNAQDYEALVLRVFVAYLALMRRILTVYMLEPAGSHGVWSLDDYQFMPFLWGSAQLIENPSIRPKHVSDKRLVEDTAGDYLYMAAIHFINSVKTGPFFEHSPILWNVSDLPTWQKINVGMTKMFQAEVLGKFPVMQHFWFGSLLRFS